ncbi:MAG: S8 family serine peptidase [Candidatus Sumerlaeia bacterium]|nr:S8 family serine peptidase [Candidatus Sumerlaeia bacterium]
MSATSVAGAWFLRVLAALAALVGCASVAGAQGEYWRDTSVPGEIVVQYRAAAPPVAWEATARGAGPGKYLLDADSGMSGQLLAVLKAAGVVEVEPLVTPASARNRAKGLHPAEGSRLHRLVLAEGADTAAIIAALRGLAVVDFAEPNYAGRLVSLPNDPLLGAQQALMDAVGLEQAWQAQIDAGKPAGGSASVRVAVIDSGVDAAHEDLVGALDLSTSFNFVSNDDAVFDDLGHGTRVAGLIGARGGNGLGMAGVAFGATLVSLDVADGAGVVTSARVASAVNYAVATGCDIANLSIAFNAKSTALEQACAAAADAGVLLVAAAGNENQGMLPVYPSSFASVLGVGALAADGQARASFSNFNGSQRDLVDLFAPGTMLLSTTPGSQYDGFLGSGTSYAAPVVAGVAALLKSTDPAQGGRALRAHLAATAAAPDAAFQPANGSGHGRVDAAAALGTPFVPALALDRMVVDDAPSHNPDNDGDGTLDVGETVNLVVHVTSTGGDATNVTGTLSSSDPAFLSLGTTTATFGAVRVGSSTSNASAPFGPILVAPVALGTQATLTLELAGDGGTSATLALVLRLEDEITLSGVVQNFAFQEDKTYRVPANLLLRGDVTIEPGTIIRSDPGVHVLASTGARLTAVGTAEKPIVFTAARRNADLKVPKPLIDPSELGPRTEPVPVNEYDHVFHVSIEAGSDATGDGSMESPWASLQHAESQIPTGAKAALLVAAGEYAVSVSALINTGKNVGIFGGFHPSTWERDIDAFRTLFVRNSSSLPVSSAILRFRGASQSRVDGIRFTATQIPHTGSAISIDFQGTSIALSNCHFSGHTQMMIADVPAVPESFTLDNCILTRTSLTFENIAVPTGSESGFARLRRNVFLQMPSIVLDTMLDDGIPAARLYGAIFEDNVFADIAGDRVEFLRVGHSRSSALYRRGVITGPVLQTMEDGNRTMFDMISNRGRLDMEDILVSGISVPHGQDHTFSTGASLTNGAIIANNRIYIGFSKFINSTMMMNDYYAVYGFRKTAILNSILFDNERRDLPFESASYSIIEGGAAGQGVMESDPMLLGVLVAGVIEDATFHPERNQSRFLFSADDSIPAGSLAGHVLLVGGMGCYVMSHGDGEAWVWGDMTGFVSYPAAWKLVTHHIRPGSPAIDAGPGPAANGSVPAADMDGDPRAGLTTDIGADQYSALTAPLAGSAWGSLRITSGIDSASLQHVVVEKSRGFIVESALAELSDITTRANHGSGLEITVPLSQPARAVRALLNYADGITAPASSVTDCEADNNSGRGIVADSVAGSIATANGGIGIRARIATDSEASSNASAGFVLLESGSGLVARHNGAHGISSAWLGSPAASSVTRSRNSTPGDGIVFGDEDFSDGDSGNGNASRHRARQLLAYNGRHGVSLSRGAVEGTTVRENAGFGVAFSDNTTNTVSGSRIEGNQSSGIRGPSSVADSVVVRNAGGVVPLTSSFTPRARVRDSYFAENGDPALDGIEVNRSVFLANLGDAIRRASTTGALEAVADSYIARNAGWGVRSTTGRGTIARSTFRHNAKGVLDVLSATQSNFIDNGTLAAEDTSSVGSDDRNFKDSYWGPTGTALLQAAAPYANMPFLRDVLDQSGTHLIDVWPFSATPVANAPDMSAIPGFLHSVSPAFEEPISIGQLEIELVFSAPMRTDADPAVTFGIAPPFTTHVVNPDPGWTDDRTWRGSLWMQADAGDGTHTLRVSGAMDANDFAIPDDLSHRLAVDTAGGLAGTNGAALALGTSEMRVLWSGDGAPDDAAGFNVLRSLSGAPGTFARANAAPVAGGEFIDTGLAEDTLYHYRIDVVRGGTSALQWTTPFAGRTEEGFLLGDVNADGAITPADAQAAFECYLDGQCAQTHKAQAADVCPGDDTPITPRDAQAIFEMFLGLEPTCEPAR